MNLRKLKIQAIVRLIGVLVLGLNSHLVATGMNPIPFDEYVVTEYLSYFVTAAMIVWVWWKDAPMTREALKAHLDMIGEKLFAKFSEDMKAELSNGKGDEQE